MLHCCQIQWSMAHVTSPAQIPSDFGFPAKEEEANEAIKVQLEKKKKKRKPRKKSPTKKLALKLEKSSISRKKAPKKKQGRALPWKV